MIKHTLKLWFFFLPVAAGALPQPDRFYANGPEVYTSEGTELPVGTSNRIVDAIATFTAAVNIKFGDISKARKFDRDVPSSVLVRSRLADISLRQSTPDELVKSAFYFPRMLKISAQERWLSYHVLDSGTGKIPARRFVGVATFHLDGGHYELDYENHLTFEKRYVADEPHEWAALHFFEYIGSRWEPVASARWQGAPFHAFYWELTNGEAIFNCRKDLESP